MFFRPKFCCNCGEKIERSEWRLLTSRRFCDLCATEYKHLDYLPAVVVVLGSCLTLFGIGNYLREPENEKGFDRVQTSAKPQQNLKPAPLYSQKAEPDNIDSGAQTAANIAAITPTGAIPQINEQPNRDAKTSEDAVFYCGALTKKGTPCTRRVKTKGFCWQHAKTGGIAPTRFR